MRKPVKQRRRAPGGGRKPRLGLGIIITISYPTHAEIGLNNPQRFEYGLAAVLAATIGMEVQAPIWLSHHQSVFKRGYHQLCFQGFTQLPSYHFSAEEIQDHSQVQPSFHRRNVSNIADPDLVDSTGLQILYQIGL